MLVSADRTKLPPVSLTETGLGMIFPMPGAGFFGVTVGVAISEVAGALVIGTVTGAGFPQETSSTAPRITADAFHTPVLQ